MVSVLPLAEGRAGVDAVSGLSFPERQIVGGPTAQLNPPGIAADQAQTHGLHRLRGFHLPSSHVSSRTIVYWTLAPFPDATETCD